jgi:hypothetical protein
VICRHGIRLNGDGHFHWLHTTDGKECEPNQKLTFERVARMIEGMRAMQKLESGVKQ